MGLFGRLFGSDGSRGEPVVKPPVDLNQPVENPKLSAAIRQFADSRSDATQAELTRQLNHAVYLVPMLTDEMRTTPTEAAGQVMIREGSVIKLIACTDDDGATHLPLFTDWSAIRAWTEEQVSTLVMPADEAWGFVLSQEDYAGAVVNPGGDALPLTRPMIEFLQSA